jgi:hypothetical protein
MTVKNTSSVPQTPVLYVITANSGFFETIRGKTVCKLDTLVGNAAVAA